MKNKAIIFIILISLIFSACKKDEETTTDTQNALALSYSFNGSYNYAVSGLKLFSKALIPLNKMETDTIFFEALLKYPVENDILVSLAVDETALTAYNDNAANTTKYAIFPVENYKIATPTATIPAGETAVRLKIAIKPRLFDIFPTGYMLPVSIATSSGIAVTQDIKTVYFHIDRDPTPPYDRTGWTVTGFSDEEATGEGVGNGKAMYALDNNANTYWQTQWSGAGAAFPHWMSFDMLAPKKLNGFYFLQRQYFPPGANSNDKAKGVVISKSDDGNTWTEIATLNLENITAVQKMPIEPVENVRYLKVTIISNHSGSRYTCMAEIRPY